MVASIILLIFTIFCATQITANYDGPHQNFEKLYQFGKNEYSDENWSGCVSYMLVALDDFNYYMDEKLWCRESCDTQIAGLKESNKIEGDVDLLFHSLMYTQSQKALCLLRCQKKRLTENRQELEDFKIYDEFQDRKPYEYLHFCYYKLNDLPKAVSNAFTLVVYNSNNTDALQSLNYYMEQPGYKKEMLVDLLKKPYEVNYINGVESYEKEDYTTCIHYFEQSLEQLFQEEKKCRLVCDDRLDFSSINNDNPEISIVFTSIYNSALQCRNNCIQKLSKVNGHRINNFLSSYFEYLHMCQFKLNRGTDAATSVANSLLLNGANMVMKRNKLFYKNQYGEKLKFEPSPVIISYHKRHANEEKYLDFVNNKFKNENLEIETPTDKALMDWEVSYEDTFNYDQLKQNILSNDECEKLRLSASLDYLKDGNKFRKDELLAEIKSRIDERYETSVEMYSLHCNEQIECQRNGFTFSLEQETCSSVVSSNFEGCLVVFCEQ